jgi:hypothetical protein
VPGIAVCGFWRYVVKRVMEALALSGYFPIYNQHCSTQKHGEGWGKGGLTSTISIINGLISGRDSF